ncbi:hypothetical protein D9757_009567 [Collybiopsis confluens]|uniref:Uncharacterized protein n=1 Tax=Collybiopsis confluens TaxID=2823264 RepID=A0A8H5H8D9_9AGAR|nr:hypothetical protein D9757_009567 [Collybiopsis confluens]
MNDTAPTCYPSSKNSELTPLVPNSTSPLQLPSSDSQIPPEARRPTYPLFADFLDYLAVMNYNIWG